VVHVEEIWLHLQTFFESIDDRDFFSIKIVAKDAVAFAENQRSRVFVWLGFLEEELHSYLDEDWNLYNSDSFE
jgi:hypothetical protein